MSDILIFVEQQDGLPGRQALEIASRAAHLVAEQGGKVLACALGPGATAAAEQLGKYGVDELLVSDSDVFAGYLTEPQVEALAQIVGETGPEAVLFPASQDGKDIASRLAARLDSGMVASTVGLERGESGLDALQSVFGGAYTATIGIRDSQTGIFVIQANAFPMVEQPKQVQIRQIEYTASPQAKRARLGEMVQEEGSPIPLEEATIIVSGGRGLGGPEPFETIIAPLAEALGGVVGASRAAVDAGWISYPHQVGQTGRTVKPQLYFAVGISGAVQHRVGMQTADTIIALNRDAEAPIFQLADLGVVGDLFQIVPALTKEVKRRKEG